MSFSNQTLKTGPLNCNGSVVDFAGTFYCIDPSYISVLLTDTYGFESELTAITDYTVTTAASEFPTSSFNVQTTQTYASGNKITIVRNTPLTQESDFGNSGPFYPQTHEAAFDKNATLIQELKEITDRCVKDTASASDPVTDPATYLADCKAYAASAEASAEAIGDNVTRTVKLRTTGNIDISTALVVGQSIDGVVLVTGDRVLVDQQTTASEDGIYSAVAAGVGTRVSDWAVGQSVSGTIITVTDGTTNGEYMFIVGNIPGDDVVGTDGLSLAAQLKSISTDNKHLVRRSGSVVEESITAAAATILDDATVGDMANTLGIGTPDNSSLEKSGSSLRVKALGVTNAMLAGSIDASKLVGSIPDSKLSGVTCKAWIRFNGTGTIAIDRSYNIASITDITTGEYRVTLTNAVSANACAVATCKSTDDEVSANTRTTGVRQSSTTTFFIDVRGSSANYDAEVVYLAIFE